MSERTWQIATGVATAAFVATAIWGVMGWTRTPVAPTPADPVASLQLEETNTPARPSESRSLRRESRPGPDLVPLTAPARPAPAPSAPLPTAGDLTDDQLDQAREILREERRAEREDRMADFADELRTAVHDFAQQEGLDSGTTQQIVSIFEAGMEHRRTTWEQVQSGDKSRWDARQESREHREQSEAELIELLGEDGMARLREHLPGPMGRGGPMSGRGPR